MANLILTVLNPIAARDIASATLLNNMTRFNNTRLTQQQQGISAQYQGRINSFGRDANKWQDVRSDLAEVQFFIEDLVRRSQRLADLGMNMLTTVSKSESGDDISALTYEAQFNSYLRSWNTEADDRGGSPNLLGSTSQRAYSYVTDITSGTETIDPYDLTNGYYIIDSSGYRWERGTQYGSFLRQTDETTGAETGTYTTITGGIRLDSLVGDAITFTIKPESSDAATFTGTLYRTGLGVLDAWLYEGLATATGRTNAQSDLHEARSMVKAQLARFKAALATANFHKGKAATNLTGLGTRIDDLATAMALELQEVQDEAGRTSSTNVLLVNQAQLIRDQYLEAFSLGQTSGLARALIDVLA